MTALTLALQLPDLCAVRTHSLLESVDTSISDVANSSQGLHGIRVRLGMAGFKRIERGDDSAVSFCRLGIHIEGCAVDQLNWNELVLLHCNALRKDDDDTSSAGDWEETN